MVRRLPMTWNKKMYSPKTSSYLSLFICSVLWILPAMAQDTPPDNDPFVAQDDFGLFRWEAGTQSLKLQPGETGELRLILTIPAMHISYADRTMVTVEEIEDLPLEAGQMQIPHTKKKKDPLGEEVDVYTETAEFIIPIRALSTPQEVSGELTVIVEHQGCSPTICYFPFDAEFKIPVTIAAGEGSSPLANEGTVEPVSTANGGQTIDEESGESGGFASAAEKGSIWLALFVFVGGFGVAFTPCVYPLIPITLGILGARKTDSHLQAFLVSATYVLGIAVMYTALGVGAAATGQLFGQVMAQPWVVGPIVLILVALGFSMLGFFDIELPAFLRNRAQGFAGGSYGGAFMMGLVSGVIAAPCTGPVLGGVLTYVAQSQDMVWGGTLLFIFSLGLGLPFLVLGTFSGLIQKAPKAGAWMEKIKHVFAVLLFAVALYTAKDAFPWIGGFLRPLPSGLIVGVVLVVAGVVLGGIHRSVVHGSAGSRSVAAVGVLLLSLGLFLGAGSFSIVKSDLPWTKIKADRETAEEELNRALASARLLQKPVVIDFTASWCSICQELERFTFSDTEVSEKLRNEFELIKLDSSSSTRLPEWMRVRFQVVGLPLVIFIGPDGQERESLRLTGFEDAEAFMKRLEGV